MHEVRVTRAIPMRLRLGIPHALGHDDVLFLAKPHGLGQRRHINAAPHHRAKARDRAVQVHILAHEAGVGPGQIGTILG